MVLQVIYDDTPAVSAPVRALIGIESFGHLIFRRRTLAQNMQAALQTAGLPPPLDLRDDADWARVRARIDAGDWPADSVLLCPSNVAAADPPEQLVTFLRQAQYSPVNLILPAQGAAENGGWTLLAADQFHDYVRKRAVGDVAGFYEQQRHRFSLADERLSLIDLNDQALLLDYLSGAFDVRFFNAISRDAFTITKRSSDKAKLRREFEFYGLLPPLMQMFFVQPFDLKDEGDVASYRMERLFIPDVALQWLHGAFQAGEFERFLDKAFYFLSIRPKRTVPQAEAAARFETLYVTKVRERVAQFKADAGYAVLEPLLRSVCGDIDALLERYLAVLNKARRRFPLDHLVVGHGDLCFSNILYNKASQTMKLIDPRGASSEDDLYVDPFYDVAKLSHSVLGSYDLINHDMFDVRVGDSMKMDLVLDRAPPEWAKPLFLQRLEAAGFAPALVRLCEASLFISMLPLHMDRPRKVLGFAVNAASILDQVETQL